MGDRSNPIKFGPEWLRNFSTERRTQTTSTVTSSTTFATVAGSAITSTTSSASSTATNTATLGAAGGGATSNVSAHTNTNTGIHGASGGGTASNVFAQSSSNTSQHNPKILLAKLRYGREEMLALYDKETAEPPSDLKYNELLYKSKEQPPMALNSTFDDEIRESMRNNQPPPPATDRGVGRSRSGTAPNEGRGRGRLYHRQLSSGRGQWSTVNPRMLGYSPGPEDQSMSRLWGPVNVRPRSPTRNGTEAEWGSQRVFRSKRMNTPNNWRAQTRDENEEWRLDSRPRSLQDKRDRSWNDRTVDKSWNSNRRPWVGSAGQNEESLPEWAVGNAEANPGTFDSSGAFHGYSNDDSSLSRTQESSYPLTRSHTHGSFVRSKTTDEGIEKDNKLSMKKFDTTEVKFKRVSFKQPLEADTANDASTSDTLNAPSTSKEENASYDSENVSESDEAPPNPSKSPENHDNSENYNTTVYNPVFSDTNSFDALMMSNINLDEGTDDRSNFQSVMIAPSNSLRQKHQNIVSSENSSGTTTLTRGYLQMLHHTSSQQSVEEGPPHQPHEVQLVEQICDMTLDDDNKITSTASSIMMNTSTSIASGISTISSMGQIPSPNMQMLMSNSTLTKPPLLMNTQSVPAPGMHQLPIVPRMNTNLNPNMGLQMETGNTPIGMRLPLHGLPVPNPSMSSTGMGATALPPSGIIGFPPSSGVPNTSADSNHSLFLGPNSNNGSIPPSDIPLPGHGPSNAFPLHGMQQRSNIQPPFRASLFPNMMQPPPTPPASSTSNLADQWYYEDPKKTIQGPFTPKEMYTWYRAGFFGPSLMVRRAIDTHMRPLGSFGPIVPFAQDMLPPFPFGSLDSHNIQGPMDTMLNQQQNLAMDVNALMGNLPSPANPGLDSMQFPVGRMNNTPFTPQPMEYPWGQPTSSSDLMWMQPINDVRNETRVNNLPPFFWDHQQSIKEMKTEDQILAQIKATQNISIPTTQSSTFFKEPLPITSVANSSDDNAFEKASLSLEELQKLIPTDVLTPNLPMTKASVAKTDPLPQHVKKTEKEVEPPTVETSATKSLPVHNKVATETKQIKPTKNEPEKAVKSKDTNGTKSKNKNKSKDDKKEDTDVKNKEDEVAKTEKRSLESSPTKSKKDEKLNKKELEKEKKDWIKEGFTIVKGSEKTSKENRKKTEEAKVAEEAEKKRKEEEKLVAEEEKKKKQAETLKRQQEQLLREQHQRHVESVTKKAPWSIASQTLQATDNEGLTLAEIQRLEREKKLEQMKEQQQMMHIIAQQQAAALAREQEMQAGLGWAKKKLNSSGLQNQTLAEIQAETRKTAAANAAAAAAVQVLEEPLTPLPTVNHVPWGNSPNGGGFWDAQPNQTMKLPEKQPEFPKPIEQPKKKKVSAVLTVKKESSPVSDFESWCTGALSSWSYKIDVPTFFGFLKDIESPYEVKDYVKCYLGETKDSSDFARQFLEKRSKLLRVGMVTPSDDLCSPAVAVNPRTASGSDNQEAKGKGKKTKKNKMLKVDARILGFSVTAAEDRINVGDIDTV